MNAESKCFAGTTPLSHCKETTPSASSSFATEGELCLPEQAASKAQCDAEGCQVCKELALPPATHGCDLQRQITDLRKQWELQQHK